MQASVAVAHLRKSKEARVEGLRGQTPQSNSILLEPINALRDMTKWPPQAGRAPTMAFFFSLGK